MAETNNFVRGLRAVKVGAPITAALTYAAVAALESLGDIKDEGVTPSPGSITDEELIDSMGNVLDSASSKAGDKYDGILIIKNLTAFAALTGGTVATTTEAGNDVLTYTGPSGSKELEKAVFFETDTEPIDGKPIYLGWVLAKLFIYPNITFNRKNWWEAKFRVSVVGPDKILKPQVTPAQG